MQVRELIAQICRFLSGSTQRRISFNYPLPRPRQPLHPRLDQRLERNELNHETLLHTQLLDIPIADHASNAVDAALSREEHEKCCLLTKRETGTPRKSRKLAMPKTRLKYIKQTRRKCMQG